MFESHLNERGQRLDWLLLAAVAGLMAVGAAFIYSAAFANDSARKLHWLQQRHVRQMIWYGLGLLVAAIFCLVDYRSLTRWSVVGYWAAILLLVLVLIPGIGATRFGARRWIDLGFFQLQPSEFAKIAFIFAQAHFLSRPVEELRQPSVFCQSLGLTLLPFALILKEPDLGSALVLFPIALVMMLVAGVPRSFIFKLVGVITGLIALLLVDILFAPPGWQIKLEEYQRHRLLTYFGIYFAPPNATPEERKKAEALQRNKSYNVEQALISVGSGGLTGKGWRQGTQYSLGFLPRGVAHNDFIFSVIAEEKGFVGSVTVLTLYAVILLGGIRIAGQARDRLGKLLAVGVVAMLFSHVFINIGMNIRLMPVTGIPLPLLSYGGSSVLCSLIAIGILQNVYLYRRSY
mgnify:FL=1